MPAPKPENTEDLFDVVYEDLHALASKLFRGRPHEQTLQPTALVHESYLRLADQRAEWRNRAHFFAIAARSMRRVLADAARARARDKRGGGARAVTLVEPSAEERVLELDVVELDEALNKLAEVGERLVRIVELRFFGGLTLEETAEALGVSKTIVVREWAKARTLLLAYVEGLE